MNAPNDLAALPVRRPNTRLTGRLIAEMQLSCYVELIRLFDGRLERSILFLVVLRRAAWINAHPDCPAPATDPAEGISINAIATSLDQPFESVRRRINAMMAEGICARGPGGVIVTAFDRPDFIATFDRMHDCMVRLIDHLRQFGVALPCPRPGMSYNPRATIAAAVDLMLAALEYVAPYFDSWRDMIAVAAVIVANARPVTFDPELAHRFGEEDTPPPGDVRRPVSISALARGLGMPYASVHRLIARARARGALEDVPGGILATTAYLGRPAIGEAGQQMMARSLRAFARLGPGGFRFDDPASCYIHGCPPLVEFR